MSRTWLVACLLLPLACSDPGVRSGTVALSSDEDSVATPADEEPTLVLRCRDGRVDAYLIVGPSPEAESGWSDQRAVRIELDSAPPCTESAP